MAPVTLLDPQPGEQICDLCAAPGGKTTQIAGRMGGEGLLLCNEIHPTRAKILSRNVERLGIANALVTNERPAALAERFPGGFDRVLVDAPCSGEGMFRKEEAAVNDWSLETVTLCAQRQQQILDCAAALVRPGGRLVYSTCTFAPEENEEVVKAFLLAHPEFSPETVNAPWFTPAGTGCFRLWPHKLRGEGHFAAVLHKDGMESADLPATQAGTLPASFLEFGRELGISLPPGKALPFGQSLFWTPESMPELAGLRVLRPGLELGSLKKNRFQPAHALALWLEDCSRTQDYPVDSRELEAFLHGDVTPSPERGWRLVTAGGFPIGWGKGDGRILKNHYPKGLRRERKN